jgi:hypothetical protein
VRAKLQILLRKEWRKPATIADVRKLAGKLGITITASGTATLSGDMTAEAFESLFGQPAKDAAGELPVPDPLKPYVESISIAPRHIFMDRRK